MTMLYYGVAYYPEFRTAEERSRDFVLLKEAGMNVIRLAEFAWSEMEPEEGRFTWEWLDEAVEEAGALGLKTVLCTPTATPPAWLVEKHPDLLYVDNQGRTRPFGGRRHYCYNNPSYRQHSARIAATMAERYGSHPHVIGWQIDNEFAQEGTGRCRCNECRTQFHQWLERKYGSIEALNEAWGTAFWSQRYNRFGQINLPIATIEPHTVKAIPMYFDNPSLRLDFERFQSESIIAYQKVQLDALRLHTSLPITHNTTGVGTNSIDQWDASRELDCFGVDHYPNLRGDSVSGSAYTYALSRSAVPGNPRFWVLELACGGGHAMWSHEGRLQPHPGAIKQAAMMAFAHGAEVVTHFQYIQFPYGAEQLNFSILDGDGKPRRRYEEVKQGAAELERVRELLEHSAVKGGEIAVCLDYDSLWALKIKPIHRDFDPIQYQVELYELLAKLGYQADVVPLDETILPYKAVVLATPFVMSDAMKEMLTRYVAGGGVLISTFLTAVKSVHNTGQRGSLPAGLAELFGASVYEVEPVFAESVAEVRLELDGAALQGGRTRYWVEPLELHGAEPIAFFADSFRKGMPLAVRNRYGQGSAYYLGTALEAAQMSAVLQRAMRDAGASAHPLVCGDGVEVVCRVTGDGRPVYVLFNVSREEAVVRLDREYEERIAGRNVAGALRMEGKSYCVLTLPE